MPSTSRGADGTNADVLEARTNIKPSSRPITPMDPNLAPISCSSPSHSRPSSALPSTSSPLILPPIELSNGTPRKNSGANLMAGLRSFSRMSIEDNEDTSFQAPPGTPGSVASGRVGRGGTFFTAVARDWGAQEEDEDDDDGQSVMSELSQFRSNEDGVDRGWAGQSSHGINPMQSPSASFDIEEPLEPERAAYMNAYEDEGLGAGAGASAIGSVMASTEYGGLNPMATPRDSQVVDRLVVFHPEEPAADSLMSMLHDLYDFNKEEEVEQEEEMDEGEGLKEEPSSSALAIHTTDLMEGLLDQVMEEQQQRRQELGDYLSQLQGLTDEDGSKLVDLPKNYFAIVEGMIRKQRGESSVLQGWLGPRRFEDLPINKLPDSHSDPSVKAGLSKIRELDSKLQDKTLEAIIVARETFPEKWAEEEQRRMEKHSLRVEEALKKERMKRMRVGRISRAFTSLLEIAEEEDGAATSPVKEPYASRYLQLRPEEEALVESILARKDEEEEINPFDVSLAMTVDQGEADREPSQALALILPLDEVVPKMTLAAINAKIEQYALTHEWAADGSLIDFASARQSTAGSNPRPSSPTGSVLSTAASKAPSQISKAHKSVKSPQASRGQVENASSMGGKGGGRDYLREQREAKELDEKEKDLDARIRAFKTSDPKVSLTRDQLFLLVEECRRLDQLQQERLRKLEEEQMMIQQKQQETAKEGVQGVQDVRKSGSGGGQRSASSSMDGSSGRGANAGGRGGGAEAVTRVKSAGTVPGSVNRKAPQGREATGITSAIKAGFLPPLPNKQSTPRK